jgi:putative ABC transport system substrate-binding protein
MNGRMSWICLAAVCCLAAGNTPVRAEPKKVRIFVVSSYHREYLWSQDTNRGLTAALLAFKYFDSDRQAEEYTRNDYVETSRAVVKKAWMDTKRLSARDDIARATVRVMDEIQAFQPDLILLGDDNAANHIGNQFIDTDIPIVFWGVNGAPLKYGLLDSIEHPGHNVTGIYQAGYVQECLQYLKRLVPEIRTFAILSDDSETGRAKAKELQNLAQQGKLALELAGSVVTNSASVWKAEALRLSDQVDAFFVLNHNTIQDDQGRVVDPMELGAWYLQNVKKPDCAQERQFAIEGMLLTVDDSGFKQAYEAMKDAHDILTGLRVPGEIPARAPSRGPIIVNRERARMLGLDLAGADFVEEYIDSALALHPPSETTKGQ